jgi:uncharacterized membrane protein YcaP (DUF421 family)
MANLSLEQPRQVARYQESPLEREERHMFFHSWMGLLRILIVGAVAYCALILFLRISGKRTLSKMNAFDLVVTVALGSTLATVLISKDVPLVEGVAAFALLILFQFVISWLSVRSAVVSRLVKSEPSLLFHRGQFLYGAMRQERVNEEEIHAAARNEGVASLTEIDAVVLETDGSFSVIKRTVEGARSTLSSVQGHIPDRVND